MEFLVFLWNLNFAYFSFGKSRFGKLRFYMGNKSTAQHMPIDLVLTPFCVLYCFPITWWGVVVTVLFY